MRALSQPPGGPCLMSTGANASDSGGDGTGQNAPFKMDRICVCEGEAGRLGKGETRSQTRRQENRGGCI